MSDELRVAIEAAKSGARKAFSFFNTNLCADYKKDQTPVTIADKETEKIIINCIKLHFPKAKFIGEESGGKISEDELWIIDPIDGTRSFTRGIPTWCVIISQARRKK